MVAWITNITHFPKPQALSKRMPRALIQTTLQFGSIVRTAAQGAANGTEPKHGCGGKIDVKVDDGNDKIIWRCTSCDDNGEISHWRGSGWENIPEEVMPKLVVVTKKNRTPKKSRRGTLVLNKRELSALKKVINDPNFDRVFATARPLGDQVYALNLTSRELDDLHRLVGDLLDFGPSRQRKMWDETLDAIAWAMDDLC